MTSSIYSTIVIAVLSASLVACGGGGEDGGSSANSNGSSSIESGDVIAPIPTGDSSESSNGGISIESGDVIASIPTGGSSESSNGGSSVDSSDVSSSTPSKTLTGIAIDGYLNKARVCLDVNNNLQCDSSDGAIVLTDEQGRYTLPVSNEALLTHNIIVQAVANQTIDMDHPGEPISDSFTYISPANDNIVVSPFSTLVSSIAKTENISIELAEAKVSNDIGLDKELFNKDFVADASSESKQIHALAQGLTIIMQASGKATDSSNDKSVLGKLLSAVDLDKLKSITDQNIDSLDTDNKDNEINTLTADLVGQAVVDGDIVVTSQITNPTAEQDTALREYQSNVIEADRLVSRIYNMYLDLEKLQESQSQAVERYNFCKVQDCERLTRYFTDIQQSQSDIDMKVDEIKLAESDLELKKESINQDYVALISVFAQSGSVDKVRNIIANRDHIADRYTSIANKVIPTTLDSDGDGVPDSIDIFSNNALEFSDIDNNGIGDYAQASSQAYNRFTVELYKSFAALTEYSGASLVVSPYSIAESLSMALAGAQQSTALELGDVLSLPTKAGSTEQQKITYFASSEPLQQIKSMKSYLSEFQAGDSTIFKATNAFWMSNTLNVTDTYKRRLSDYFGAQVEQQDFTAPELVAANINAWASRNTNGEIDSVINSDEINNLTRSILTNAIYFKGIWVNEFDESNTKNKPFYTSVNGSINSQSTPMMSITASYKYQDVAIGSVDVNSVEMDYGNGRYSMVAILPAIENTDYANTDDLSLTALENALNGDELEAFLIALEKKTAKKVELTFPKFKTENELDAIEALKVMGLEAPFNASADFSGISDETLKISKIKHKAVIEVEEKGTVAAAVTTASLAGRVIRSTYLFDANRPFIYLIRDKQLNTILFIGKFSG